MAVRLRPPALYPYFRSVSGLRGVGPVTRKALARLLTPPRPILGEQEYEPVLRDLLMHAPTGAEDRRQVTSIARAEPGTMVSLDVEVVEHKPPPERRPNMPYRVFTRDASGILTLNYFHVKGDYLLKQLPVGERRFISGTVEWYDGRKIMAHPDMVVPPHRAAEILRVMPVYPLTLGISQRVLLRLMDQALTVATPLPEWIDATLLERQHWQGWLSSLKSLHRPDSPEFTLATPARQRLAYDELLAHQLALGLSRRHQQVPATYPVPANAALNARLTAALPFTLTNAQEAALAEMTRDLASGQRMIRLLQGDVGSGKTILAFALMAEVAALGFQAAFMAPTDLLARQHEKTLTPLAEKLGFRLIFLSGKMTKAAQSKARAAIQAGEVALVIGTHALFQEEVIFKNLALLVVDEQHRFGVEQRLQLAEKGLSPHILQMTATPIPRSLAMTYYGDMEVSVLNEKPPGRQPIDTRVIPIDRLSEVVEGLGRVLAKGQKAYWVCPLIEATQGELDQKTEEADIAAAEARLTMLTSHFGAKVGLVHGRMKVAERERVMRAFAEGDLQLLVATTVIEVGVDVPDATIMIIEQAERFGLAQLHQLRGRVGRGYAASSCVLLYHPPLSEYGKARLSVLRATNDGFAIAEEDLKLRGAGDVLGTRQTGLPSFHFASIIEDRELVSIARDDVKLYLSKDPDLTGTRGQALRQLLSLFDYDHTVKLLKAA